MNEYRLQLKTLKITQQCIFLNLCLVICVIFCGLPISAKAAEEVAEKIVRGTIVESLVTTTLDGAVFQILTLNDGKKYRLLPEHGMGFAKKYDVEIKIKSGKEPNGEDEISMRYPNTIPVSSIKITAIPILGSNKKIKYPLTDPPEIINSDN